MHLKDTSKNMQWAHLFSTTQYMWLILTVTLLLMQLDWVQRVYVESCKTSQDLFV